VTAIDQIKQLCLVTMDNCTAYQNFKFGISINNFYGLVHMVNSVSSENEGHGILLTGQSALGTESVEQTATESDISQL